MKIKKNRIYSDKKIHGIISPSTIIGKNKNGTYTISGKNGFFTQQEKTKESLIECLKESGSIITGSKNEIKKTINLLKNPRTSRTTSYISTISNTCQEIIEKTKSIKKSKILIVGCGGIGSMTAINLTGAGVRKITIIDPDTIEESNLNRQFFWRKKDCNKKKATTLKKYIKKIHKKARIKTIASRLPIDKIAKISKDHDVIIVTADEPLGISKEISQSTTKFFIFSGYFHNKIGIYAFKPNKKNHHPESETTWHRHEQFIAPSFGPSNTELAGIVSSTCLHYLFKKNKSHTTPINQTWTSSRLSNEN